MTIRYDVLRELEEYTDLENSEIGELCQLLTRLSRTNISDKFRKALDKEIDKNLEMFKTRTKIVEETVTTTTTYRRLEWD